MILGRIIKKVWLEFNSGAILIATSNSFKVSFRLVYTKKKAGKIKISLSSYSGLIMKLIRIEKEKILRMFDFPFFAIYYYCGIKR